MFSVLLSHLRLSVDVLTSVTQVTTSGMHCIYLHLTSVPMPITGWDSYPIVNYKRESPKDSETPGIGWYPPPHGLMKISDPEFFNYFFGFLAL